MRSLYALPIVLGSILVFPIQPILLKAQAAGPQTDHPRPMRIRESEGAAAQALAMRVEPAYPEEAKRKQIEGQVVLHAIIAADGSVKELTLISGPQELTQAALDAVMKWRYKPSLLNGMPLEVDTTIKVDFVLKPGPGTSAAPSDGRTSSASVLNSPGHEASQEQEPPPCASPTKSYSEVQCLDDFAGVMESEGKFGNAEEALKRALAVEGKANGPDDPKVAWSAQRLAYSYMKDRKYSEAEPYLKQAIAIRKKSLGPDAPEVADSLLLLGRTSSAQREFEEAEPSYVQALTIRQKAFPPDSPGYANVAEAMDDLGMFYVSQNKLMQAEPLFEQALEIRRKAYQPNHPFLAYSLDHLAVVYTMRGKNEQAEPLFKQAVTIIESPLGGNPSSYGDFILDDYANLLRNMNRIIEAEAMRARAQAIRDKQQGN